MQFTHAAKVHLLACIASVFGVVHFNNDAIVSMVMVELSVLYVMLTHYRQRELLPSLVIILLSKILVLPLTLNLYSAASVKEYVELLLVSDLLTALALHKGYRSSALRKIFGVQTPARKIPQVLAMCTLLYLGVVHLCLVWGEIRLWENDETFFSSTPFFYGSFELVRTLHKMLLLLAIWSMCLDSYFVDYERYRRLTGVVKTN